LEEHSDIFYQSPCLGHPQVLDDRDLYQAACAIMSGFASDATNLKCKLFLKVSIQSVQRGLSRISMHGRIRRKK
ncbi:hypothetical protein C8Q75DRAFT_690619, partial [Abortiporus biennis]